jgi:uncharacterized cupin superfamily protein
MGADPGAYTVIHVDAMEQPWPNWRLARKALGVEAFGLNVAELQPGEQITEHDELDRDQEEVFVALEGDAVLVVDGEEVPLPCGAFARVAPPPQRYVVNRADRRARILIVSAPTTSGYEPMEWA